MSFKDDDIRFDALGFLTAFIDKILSDYRIYVDSNGRSYALVDGWEIFEAIINRGVIQDVAARQGTQMARAVAQMIEGNSLSEEDAQLIAQAIGETFRKRGIVFRMNLDRNPNIPNRYFVKFEMSW